MSSEIVYMASVILIISCRNLFLIATVPYIPFFLQILLLTEDVIIDITMTGVRSCI